jgi:putative FmdB family regulatory protein
MPLYEYECKKCHHRFERIQKYSDRHMKKCPDCGGTVELVVSAPAVQFKGSGWYVNDYAKKSSATSSSSNGESGSKAESGAKAESGSKGDSEAKGESESKSKKEEKPSTSGKKTEKKASSNDKS